MPRSHCEDHGEGCRCATRFTSMDQSLDEVAFMKSACSAARSGNIDRLKELISKDPCVVHRDGTNGNSGYTPLHYASRAGHTASVRLLLNSGARIDKRTTAGGATSLHRAAHMGHTHIVELLVEHGADGMIQDKDGESPLHKALKQGHMGTAQALMAKFPDSLKLPDRHGTTPQEILEAMKDTS